jgi:hypothetical protein
MQLVCSPTPGTPSSIARATASTSAQDMSSHGVSAISAALRTEAARSEAPSSCFAPLMSVVGSAAKGE